MANGRAKGSGNRTARKKAGAKDIKRPSFAPVVGDGAKNDLIGVGIAVLAVALLISLVAPSTALVTHAVGQALVLGFGSGALLIPFALFAFAVTFFIGSDDPLSARAAIGLTIVVVAVLAMLSLNVEGADVNPDLVFERGALASAGGFVGAGIAWTLLALVGRLVGFVLLVGLAMIGMVVCGLSISGIVERLRGKASAARESFLESRAPGAPTPYAEGIYRAGQAPARQAPAGVEPATSYIGGRKTSVLKRGRQLRDQIVGALSGDEGEKFVDEAYVDDYATVAQDPPTERRSSVPEFLSEGEAAEEAAPKRKRASKPKESKPKAAPAPANAKRPGEGSETIELPPLSILKSNPNSGKSGGNREQLMGVAQRLQSTLEEFGLASRVEGWVAGPTVTTFKIAMGEGERVSKITNLEADIALSLAAKSVRIFAPIPGTSLVGIEIPNEEFEKVCLGDVLPYAQGGPLDVAIGRDAEGKPIVVDLAGLPHVLVAGTTGSGKSVVLNSMIVSMLMRATPEQVRLIMVDPKRVEFTGYAGLPHLYVPVVTEPRQAASALQWSVTEMERRLKVFEHYKVRDIGSFNKSIEHGKVSEMENPPQKMPYFVIVIDELADLMMVAKQDVESSIVRIAQLGRAAGIHLVVATQRPSADVVTGLIKANIDNRIALAVDNGMNSRIILDSNGAERLLGKGDMLIKLRGRKPRRAQGCLVSDSEIEQTVEFIKSQVEPDYHEDILSAVSPGQPGASTGADAAEDDPLVWEAAQVVVDSQLGSTSGLQRRLKVGYARAGRIMDILEQKGVVGPPDGSKPREVLLDAQGLEELMAADAEFKEV